MNALLLASCCWIAIGAEGWAQDDKPKPPPKPGGFTGVDWGGSAPASPDPAPAPPDPAPAPAPAAADPAGAAKLAKLREQLAAGRRVTGENIVPFATLEEATEKARRYRRLVDKTLRQPFLAGLRPSPELAARVKDSVQRWGEIGAAIRAGTPPASLPSAKVAGLKLAGNLPAGDPVRMTGALWSAMSDEYFRETLEIENLGADLARQVRNAPGLTSMEDAMEQAEQALERARNLPEADRRFWLRSTAWLLHRVWQRGMELQVKLAERNLIPSPDSETVESFLRDMDAARGLRHRGFSLAPEGGAPAPNRTPATLVRDPRNTIQVPENGAVRATLADARTSVDVAAPAPNRLPQLAAELYHVHYLLRRVEDFEREPALPAGKPGPERDSRIKEAEEARRTRVAERRRDYEGRRGQILQEMTTEADRVLSGRR